MSTVWRDLLTNRYRSSCPYSYVQYTGRVELIPKPCSTKQSLRLLSTKSNTSAAAAMSAYHWLLLLAFVVPVHHAWMLSPVGSRFAATTARTRISSSLPLQDAVLMPDGGVSPCVIRVIGVGGGGCNAVRDDKSTMQAGMHAWRSTS